MSDAASEQRSAFDFRIRREAGAARPQTRLCEHPGCVAAGEHRAPKSRENLREHRWLCLPHVREFNESWDFFRGMSADEVDRFQRDAMTGHRPTWKMKDRSSAPWEARADAARWRPDGVRDSYGVFEDGEVRAAPVDRPEAPRAKVRTRLQMDALHQLGLDGDASLPDVKSRYKELVKRYHPDANGGDRSAEERLTAVIRAYALLKKSNFS